MRLVSLLLCLLPACSDARPAEEQAPGAPAPAPPPVETADTAFDPAVFARGAAIQRDVCSQCHTLEPPPLTAPTLGEISVRYHEVYQEPLEAIDHLSEYIRQPAPGASHLPQVMLDEWGVMPPQALPEADRRAVAYYLWHFRNRPAG